MSYEDTAEWEGSRVLRLRSGRPHALRPTGLPYWRPTVRCGGHGAAGGGAEREAEFAHSHSLGFGDRVERARGTHLRPVSAEVAWGRGRAAARRATVGGGGGGLAAWPRPLRSAAGGRADAGLRLPRLLR